MKTLKQIADLVHVSKTTVRRYVKQIEAERGTEYIKRHTSLSESGVLQLSECFAQQLQNTIKNTPIKQKIALQATGTPEQANQNIATQEHKNRNTETNDVSMNRNIETGYRNIETNDVPMNRNIETGYRNIETNDVPMNRNIETEDRNTGTSETISAFNMTIDTLKEQMAVYLLQIQNKDEQLSEKDKQIAMLQDQNKALTDALVAAQTLHAATIQQNALVMKDEKTELKWWQRIFKKKEN